MSFQTAKWTIDAETGDMPEDQSEKKKEWGRQNRIEGAKMRQQLQHRLEDEGEFDFAKKIAGCGLPVPLICSNCGTHKVAETQCRQRWCPACAWTIKQKRLTRFRGAVALMKWPLFVTLTRANADDPETVREFRAEWSKMRRRKIIADKIRGGVCGLEITNVGNGWHPHLHAIVDCEWLAIHTPKPHWGDTPEIVREKCKHAQAELAWLWGAVCKQRNSLVWVQRVRSDAALVYSLAYSIKGTDLLESPDPIGPLLKVLKKTRLVSAFGSLHGMTKTMDADERPAMVCECCGLEKTICPTSVIYSIARTEPEKLLPSMLRKAPPPSGSPTPTVSSSHKS